MRDDPGVTALVKRARDGDQEAWNALVDRFAPLVWSVCRRHDLSRADAEEAGSNVWLRLVEGLGSLREPAALPGWLVTVTRRECLRVVSGRRGQVLVADDRFPGEDGLAADAEVLKQEQYLALREAFAGLSDRCRRLLTLLFSEPRPSYTEISDRLDMRVGGIGPTRLRCLDALRRSAPLAPYVTAPEA
ncbi:RNA polymerase sigma factor [Amycolatopsis solani]|uniref:RNA polymerase sigma factor n=1 Tax=Amycolatopsis solani TaxID=3028615 RepID=UPI0025B0B05C|nr:sigma-70 family RNA polymerase sigma factor [Amycolatopsis sp. MEP2-6]